MLCVVVADNQPLTQIGVAKILSDALQAKVETVETVAELRTSLGNAAPDVLILDLTLGGGSMLEVIPELRLLYPELPILVLSTHPERYAGVKAILAGANGYLSKTCDPDELVEAVRQLVKGGRYISKALGLALADYLVQPQVTPKPHDKLSPREHAVLVKITEGFTTSEIAEQLGLSSKTVGTYRARILVKMVISTTAGLTRYVMENCIEDDRNA